MMVWTFFKWARSGRALAVFPSLDRLGRAALLAAIAAICLAGLSGCATIGYYNVTDFDTVVIDAGHGGRDSGAFTRGRGPQLLEKDLALDVAWRLQGKLRAAGFRTVMTRRSDRFISLDDRVDVSNSYSDSIFVAIHFNDARRRGIHGAETYHNRRGTWQLAARIERAMATLPGGADRGVKTANYRVLRKSKGPAVLVECGFLSNPSEAARCSTAAFREKIADRLARAIIAQRQ